MANTNCPVDAGVAIGGGSRSSRPAPLPALTSILLDSINNQKRRRDGNEGALLINATRKRPSIRNNAGSICTTDDIIGVQRASAASRTGQHLPEAFESFSAASSLASNATSAFSQVPRNGPPTTQRNHSNNSYHSSASSHTPSARTASEDEISYIPASAPYHQQKSNSTTTAKQPLRVVSPILPKVDESLLLVPHDLDYARGKAKMLIKLTRDNLAKNGHGPITNEERELLDNIESIALYSLELAHSIIVEELCTHDGKFLLRHMSKDLGKLLMNYRLLIRKGSNGTNDEWKTGCTNSVTKGGKGRVLEQLKVLLNLTTDDEVANLDLTEYARVYLILDEMLELMDRHPQLKQVAMNLIAITPSSRSHKDHTKVAVFQETTNFCFEFWNASIFPGRRTYVLEKLFDLGSTGLRGAFRILSSDANAVAGRQLSGVQNIHTLMTWIPYITAMRDDVEDLGSSEVGCRTRRAVDAMLRPPPDNGFLQMHETMTVLGNGELVEVEPYVNAVTETAPYEALKQAAVPITVAVLDSDLSPDEKNESVRVAIGTIDNASQHSVRYVAPPEDVFRISCEQAFHVKVAAVAASPSSKELIICERSFKDSLTAETQCKFFPKESSTKIFDVDGSVAGELWKLSNEHSVDGKEILVLVVPSWHVIWGDCHTLIQRLNNAKAKVAIMSVLEAACIIPVGSTERERQIMLASFMMWEGYSGNLPKEEVGGSFHKARRSATPNGYFLRPALPGVRALGNVLSGGIGVNDFHVIALMMEMGYDNFERMLEDVFDITVDESDFAAFLARLKKEQESERAKQWNTTKKEHTKHSSKQRRRDTLVISNLNHSFLSFRLNRVTSVHRDIK